MKKKKFALATVALLCVLTLFGCVANEPDAKVNEPAVSVSEPAVSAGEPAVSAGEPAANVSEPAASVSRPAANANQPTVNVDVFIGDEYYIATVRSIIENFADYYGQSVRIEGVFFTHGTDTIYRMVMRQDFSC